MRAVEELGLIPLYEGKDWTAGGDSDSVSMAYGATLDIVILTGVLTAPGTISLFSGATAAAKTTALPFTYRLSNGDYAAANADTFPAADTAVANGVLTLSATAHDHRVLVLHIDAADVAANGAGHIWVTMAIAAGTAQVLAALGLMRPPRVQPPITAI